MNQWKKNPKRSVKKSIIRNCSGIKGESKPSISEQRHWESIPGASVFAPPLPAKLIVRHTIILF